LQEGINSVNPNIPQKVIANENLALEYIYENHQAGALYTVMCDVVAGALDKIKELKDRESVG
jgi:cyanophycin synthetase